MTKVEEYSSSSTGWNELPEDISQEILALLPVESLCRSRSVCKEWNVLFSSSKFITNRWAEAPPNKKPWLFLCRESDEGPVNSSAYCFFTQTWKNCSSLSFISKRSEYAKYGAFYRGSAQGMFLVDVYSDGPCRYYVCNPLTRVFLKLPSQSSIGYILTRDIVAWNVGNQETYKVVVVGLSREWDVMIAETYDASEKSWVVVGHLPGNFDYFDLSRGIVFCDGLFYFTGRGHHPAWMGVFCFSSRGEISMFTPFPVFANGNTIDWPTLPVPELLICGSRILLAGILVGVPFELILWEFDKDSNPSSPSWKEIARLPPAMREVYIERNTLLNSFHSVAVGDCMCFTCGLSLVVAVYNLSEETWSWLATPTSKRPRIQHHHRLMAFNPRPDMKADEASPCP